MFPGVTISRHNVPLRACCVLISAPCGDKGGEMVLSMNRCTFITVPCIKNHLYVLWNSFHFLKFGWCVVGNGRCVGGGGGRCHSEQPQDYVRIVATRLALSSGAKPCLSSWLHSYPIQLWESFLGWFKEQHKLHNSKVCLKIQLHMLLSCFNNYTLCAFSLSHVIQV